MDDVFRTVLCGVDGSDEALATARLACRLAPADARVELLAVEDTRVAVQAGWGASAVLAQLDAETERALGRATAICRAIRPVAGRLLAGHPPQALLDEAREWEATLVAVGGRGHSRALGILLGSVATTLLHEAQCSVLVGRGDARLPTRVLAGDDGSDGAWAAVAAARALGDRLGIPVETRSFDAAEAVDSLVGWARPDELLVVGSRGLKGVRALGSVSERVAHRARCPVLVVRSRERREEHR